MKKLWLRFMGACLRMLVRMMGRIIYRIRIQGVEHIPQQGGALIVANHTSYMDFVLLVCGLPRPVRFIMNAHTFRKPMLNALLRGLHCVPVETGMGKQGHEEFNRVVKEQLDEGHLVAIFAEGTVSRTGQLLEFRKGVEHISQMITAPIIAVHFDNVQGSPYTYRAGGKKMVVPSLRSLRRLVRINIGKPMHGATTAFHLRQKMKELEAESFAQRISLREKISSLVLKNICNAPSGSWRINNDKMEFSELGSKISSLHLVLKEHLEGEKAVGVLLPKSLDSLLIHLYLLLNDKCIVNIHPDMDNEDRLAVFRQSGLRALITTRNLSFARLAPNAHTIIYIEDILQSLASGKKLSPVCSGAQRFRNEMMSWFRWTSPVPNAVTILFEKKNDTLVSVSLSHGNLMAVITALRQVYFFRKGSMMLADLDLFHSYGFVLEFLMPLISDLNLETLPEQCDEKHFMEKLLEHQPSLVLTTPTQLNALAELSQVRNLPFLTNIFTADIDPEHDAVDVLEQRGLPVMTCAGLNATTSVIAVNLANVKGKDLAGKDLEQENYERGSIGKPLPGVALRIADENDSGKELAAGAVGKILVMGASIASVNGRDDVEGEHPQEAARWLDTGWRGYMNAKGFVFLEE
ncbi:MAG: 1-acyl-sn-glycerol-3-phosphate acyltransferase [Flavobacteriales bacterium]|nr:1-acyl-sn-glycerol-3-phosphate acyltransferase [Flavobacteriales bacterium]